MFAREVLSRGFGRRRGKFRVGDSDAGNFGGKVFGFRDFFFLFSLGLASILFFK